MSCAIVCSRVGPEAYLKVQRVYGFGFSASKGEMEYMEMLKVEKLKLWKLGLKR